MFGFLTAGKNQLRKQQSENGGCGSLPVVVGRSLPRAIAAARSAGRAPPFEQAVPTLTRGENEHSSAKTSKGCGIEKTRDRERGEPLEGVAIEDMIAGHPRRAQEELDMRARLEVVREEVDSALKTHGSMAKGERTIWLKKIERQNEENAYQVICRAVFCTIVNTAQNRKYTKGYYG